MFVNASNRPANQSITDRDIAMIPLSSRWGRTLDWRKQKKASLVQRIMICQESLACHRSSTMTQLGLNYLASSDSCR